jgi:hypothetical protein
VTTVLRPLSTGELLDRTFSIYRSYFGLFVGIFSLPYLMVLVFQCAGLVFQSPVPQLSNILITSLWTIASWLLSVISSAASQAATVVAVSNIHLERPASIADSFKVVKGQIFAVLGISLLVAFVGSLALVAFIVPGVLLFVMWSLSIPAKVLENRGVLESMSRSMELTKGSRGRIFVIGLLMLVLTLGITWLLQWPILLAAGAGFTSGLRRVAIGWQVASLVATFVSRSLVGALGTIALSLVYYDQRVRKEAFDLQLMMMTLDTPPPSPVPDPPAQVGA